MSKLEGKVALVSGSGRGIGRCVAEKLASEGARIVVNDLDEAPAMETVEALKASGAEAVACIGSVVEDGFAERFIGTAIDNWGTPDIIVNNAGYTWDSVIQKMTDEQFQAIMDVHVTAPFRILRAAAEPIRIAAKKEAREGQEIFRKVVNISSTSGYFGNAGQANYSAAKAAIVGMTKALSREWGRYKVNVNAVGFGLVHTRLTQALDGEGASIDIEGRNIAVGIQRARLEAAGTNMSLGRGGYPEEAAGAIYLMCTPESNYITGQLLMCDGGR
ncbi:MAG: SDR family oxidoreductase [Alphaproteobacteria bacterium]|nr:SDR family oxidoreductase [Alphaproteobacteria bacterium]